MAGDSEVKPVSRMPAGYNNVGGGSHGMIRYPKHVWSPTGGWYSNPSNWKTNTAVCFGVTFMIVGALWNLSANREVRTKMPEPGRFYPSRYWSRQIIEHEKKKVSESSSS